MSSVGRLQALQQQVDALQQQINELQGAEALSPNYLTVTPGGLVGADFTGLINAQGLIIPASVFTTPGPLNSIQWIRQSDGSQVATIGAGQQPGGTANLLQFIEDPDHGAYQCQFDMTANGFSAPGAVATIQVETGSGNNSFVQLSGTPSYDSLSVQTGSRGALIKDSNNNSSFLQTLGTGTNLWVEANQASFTLAPGYNTYTQNFLAAFTGQPTIVFTIQAGGGVVGGQELSGGGLTSFTFDVDGLAGAPAQIWYIAIGPR